MVILIPVAGLFALFSLIYVDPCRLSAYATTWWKKLRRCSRLRVMIPSVGLSQIESFVEDIEDLKDFAAIAGRNTCCIWLEKENQ